MEAAASGLGSGSGGAPIVAGALPAYVKWKALGATVRGGKRSRARIENAVPGRHPVRFERTETYEADWEGFECMASANAAAGARSEWTRIGGDPERAVPRVASVGFAQFGAERKADFPIPAQARCFVCFEKKAGGSAGIAFLFGDGRRGVACAEKKCTRAFVTDVEIDREFSAVFGEWLCGFVDDLGKRADAIVEGEEFRPVPKAAAHAEFPGFSAVVNVERVHATYAEFLPARTVGAYVSGAVEEMYERFERVPPDQRIALYRLFAARFGAYLAPDFLAKVAERILTQ